MGGTRDLIRLAGSTLDRSRHVCAFFNGREEEYRVLLPFIREGIDQGERAFHIVDPRLRSHGVLEADVVLLRKPFTPAELERAVREALDRSSGS